MSLSKALPRWLLMTGFAVALVLVLVFGLRTVIAARYWSDPAHGDQRIEGWMPPRYIARSWDVPPEVLADVLGLDPGSRERRNLEQIARDLGVPLDELIARLTRTIHDHREVQGE